MTIERAYLDYNASAPLRPEALAVMFDIYARPGNASSVHGEGRYYRKCVEAARVQVADLVAAEPDGVIFTGSATEAAHLGLTPAISSNGAARPADKLFVLETEHPCILAGGRFEPEQVISVPVQSNGLADVDGLEEILSQHAGIIPYLAVQLANSETGIVQPVAELAKLVRLRGGYVLCDAVQAVGRMPVDIGQLGVDFLLVSAHKIGGPQGVGALICAPSALEIAPAIRGGGQEMNRRAGTENVAAIAGFGAAAALAAKEAENYLSIRALRDSIESELHPICAAQGLADCLTVYGADVARIENTILFSVEGLNAETALIAFDLDGVAVSSGSACSSGKVGRSHVLQAMGVDAKSARGAIRLSLGWKSTEQDKDKFFRAFNRITRRLAEMTDMRLSGAA